MLERMYLTDENERKKAAERELAEFQQQQLRQVPATIRVLVGDAAAAIVDYAGEGATRMIAMPTRGFGPFRQMLIGSVTAKVLHDAKVPVITGPHLEAARVPRYLARPRRILCALSLEWETDGVLRKGGELAQELGAELIAAHVITLADEVLVPLMRPGSASITAESVEQEMRKALSRVGVSAELYIARGEISRQVAAAARDRDVDLIVIGRGGAPELSGRLGSHGYAIVRRAPCPVLCV
jgi:nucleotide-binding universal stress UspA family protein